MNNSNYRPFNVNNEVELQLHPSENSDLGRLPQSNPFIENISSQDQEILKLEKYYQIMSFFFYFFAGFELLAFIWFGLSGAWFYLIGIPLLVIGMMGAKMKNRSMLLVFSIFHGLIAAFFFILVVIVLSSSTSNKYKSLILSVVAIIFFFLLCTTVFSFLLLRTLHSLFILAPNYETQIRDVHQNANIVQNNYPQNYHVQMQNQQVPLQNFPVQNYPVQNYPVQNYPVQNIGYPQTQNYPVQNYPVQNYPVQNYPVQNLGYPQMNNVPVQGYSMQPPNNVYVVQNNPPLSNDNNNNEETLVDLKNN
eukprot:TRINITY_DN14_c0_g1_i1.p1 TRINITY_DN14_c0_g1~~TRINITY_DN14_c0_g1_i1.p1  ORF type:complete len:315 (-),score=65.35 TRINITY_DN14_c0_g1_i1:46-963(-)